MKTSLMRRLVAGAAGLAIGAIGAVALASPASAHHPEVMSDAFCDEVTGEWVVHWTVENSESDLEGTVTEVRTGTSPDGLEDTLPELSQIVVGAILPVKGEGQLTEEWRLPGDIDLQSIELHVKVQWQRATHVVEEERGAGVLLTGTCEGVTDELGGWVFDCDTLSVTLENPFEDALTFTFVPSVGDAQDLTVEGGESGTVEFPASEGLNIDVFFEDEQIDLVEPIEITSEAWAALGCDDDGEGGELPVTGASTALMAAGALALLALGGGMFMLARRRRVTFTA